MNLISLDLGSWWLQIEEHKSHCLGKLFLREDIVPCAACELSWSSCESCVLKGNPALCFAGKPYLTRQRMTQITTPCLRSGRGGLPGERGSVSGDKSGAVPKPRHPWERLAWLQPQPHVGTVPPQRREDSDSSMLWNTSTLWNGSRTHSTPSAFPNQGLHCAGHHLNPVEPKI